MNGYDHIQKLHLCKSEMAEEFGGHYELKKIFKEEIWLKLSTESLRWEEYEVSLSFCAISFGSCTLLLSNQP